MKAVIDYSRLSLMVLTCVIFYNEFLVYFNSYRGWPQPASKKNLLKVLLVADPQIQGAHDMDNWLLGLITRWDSDRYLSKTFSWAKYAYAPDVVVFLGDLMDEGSTAESESEYQNYVKRFKSIYETKAFKIFVAGDNDIGGEGGDPLTPSKIDRFNKNFPSRPNFMFQISSEKIIQRYEVENEDNIVEIIPANVLTFKQDFDIPNTTQSKFKIVVSHMPILPSGNSAFSQQVLHQLKPNLILSAHDHRGLDYSANEKDRNVTIFTAKTEEMIEIRGDSKHEIIVPTCSYRMGVKEMAFGLLQIKDGKVTYQNLWLPSRFPLLYVYLAAISVSLTLFLISKVKKKVRRASSTPRRRRSSTKLV